MTWFILSVAALFTAIISALFGMGGGIVLLAVMTIFLAAEIIVPVHGVVQLASNASRTAAFARHLHWKIFSYFAPGALLGMSLAVYFYQPGDFSWYKPTVGAFILLFLAMRRFKPSFTNMPIPLFTVVGVIAGFAGIYVGATGPLLAPFFLRGDLSKENIVGSKAAAQIVVHAGKIPAFLSLGFDYSDYWQPIALMVVAVIIGTGIGKKLHRHFDQKTFVLGFQIVLLCTAIRLIVF